MSSKRGSWVSGSPRVWLDLNDSEFQQDLFALGKEQQTSVLRTLRKLSRMSWEQVYQDSGLNWEAIYSRTGLRGERLYSFRIGKGFRAVARRDGDWLKILSLHPDHDSAYR
jgi:hypothetical protein